MRGLFVTRPQFPAIWFRGTLEELFALGALSFARATREFFYPHRPCLYGFIRAVEFLLYNTRWCTP
jgi:hypothetical protein